MGDSPPLRLVFFILFVLALWPSAESGGMTIADVPGSELASRETVGNPNELSHQKDYKPATANTDPYMRNVTSPPTSSLGTSAGNSSGKIKPTKYDHPGPNIDPCNVTCPTPGKAITERKP